MVTSWRPEDILVEDVDMSEDVDDGPSVKDEVVSRDEAGDDVQVGGVEDVSRQARVDERLWLESELLSWLGGAIGSGGMGGKAG